jgi:NAD(P)-dependent dehydrogenase (short-subunit alcohol dehydrogenase family)
MEFEDRTAIVTGGGHGIGRATSLLLAERGARVIVADIDTDRAESVVAECGDGHLSMQVDVREPDSVAKLTAAAIDACGRIDILANVAGIYPMAPMIETTDEMWRDVMATNLDGTFHMCRALGPHLLENQRGSIINVTSGAARIPYVSLSAYAASKGGVISFTRTIAAELAPHVRANVIGPGPTNVWDQPPDLTGIEGLTDAIPMGRYAEPEEIAEGIAFFASDRAGFVTGQILHVNGGRSMH